MEGRDFTYNLNHLRHHLDFTDTSYSRHNKMNQSFSFHVSKNPVKLKPKTPKYVQYTTRKEPSRVHLELPKTLNSE